jgi:hypothetical protein
MPDKKDEPQNSNTTDAQSEKFRYGAPVGPRKNRRQYYDGREPLEFPGHEETASFLAFPKTWREYKSVAALARHFNVTRVTVYRWMQDINVLKRADSISMQNKIAGNLVARREYISIFERAVEMAKEGNIKAMEFCADRAFPEDEQAKKSGISSSSLEEVLEKTEIVYEKHAEMMTPTWLKERAMRLASEKPPVEPAGPPPAISDVQLIKAETEPQPAPQPEPAHVNFCDACGKTRCVHGRCPGCEICEVCEQPAPG